MKRIALLPCAGLVLSLTLTPTTSRAQPPTTAPATDGLFLPLGGGRSAEVRGILPGAIQAAEPDAAGVLRSRRVALDTARLDQLALSFLERSDTDPAPDQTPLVFNFFDDAAIEIVVDTVEPTVLENGYVVSGSVPGALGSVVLVVHFDDNDQVAAISGSASAAEGAFRVSTVRRRTCTPLKNSTPRFRGVDGVLPAG